MSPEPRLWRALAPAKINLCLHVGAVDDDGFHSLASLVTFADVGDGVSLRLGGDTTRLAVTGPFAKAIDSDPADNLIFKALDALARTVGQPLPPLEITLDKQLPVASGMGGGSSDAGAVLKLANAALELGLDEQALEAVAAQVGSDGPMCLRARPVWATGRGDRLEDVPQMPLLHAVLVNPGVPSLTGAVYRAYDADPVKTADLYEPLEWTAPALIDWLSTTRNDLEAPAIALEPGIAAARDHLRGQSGVWLVRMSGSGATVFAVFASAHDADQAARAVALDHPYWWVRRTDLGKPARLWS